MFLPKILLRIWRTSNGLAQTGQILKPLLVLQRGFWISSVKRFQGFRNTHSFQRSKVNIWRIWKTALDLKNLLLSATSQKTTPLCCRMKFSPTTGIMNKLLFILSHLFYGRKWQRFSWQSGDHFELSAAWYCRCSFISEMFDTFCLSIYYFCFVFWFLLLSLPL